MSFARGSLRQVGRQGPNAEFADCAGCFVDGDLFGEASG